MHKAKQTSLLTFYKRPMSENYTPSSTFPKTSNPDIT